MQLLTFQIPQTSNVKLQYYYYFHLMAAFQDEHLPSVLWHCWLGSRTGIQPVKNWVVGCWRGYVWVNVQICIWPSWCYCHSMSLAPVNTDWYYIPDFTFLELTRVVLDKIQEGHKMVVCVFFSRWSWVRWLPLGSSSSSCSEEISGTDF